MLLAISDIYADMGEASLGTRANRKFMWRHKRCFLSPLNAAAVYAFNAGSEPNFSFLLHALAVCFPGTRKTISRFS
jgi:hypothetical protein